MKKTKHIKLYEEFDSDVNYDTPITKGSKEYDDLVKDIYDDLYYNSNRTTKDNIDNSTVWIADVVASWGITYRDYGNFLDGFSWEGSGDYYYDILAHMVRGYCKLKISEITGIDYWDVEYEDALNVHNMLRGFDGSNDFGENRSKKLASEEFKKLVVDKILEYLESKAEWDPDEED